MPRSSRSMALAFPLLPLAAQALWPGHLLAIGSSHIAKRLKQQDLDSKVSFVDATKLAGSLPPATLGGGAQGVGSFPPVVIGGESQIVASPSAFVDTTKLARALPAVTFGGGAQGVGSLLIPPVVIGGESQIVASPSASPCAATPCRDGPCARALAASDAKTAALEQEYLQKMLDAASTGLNAAMSRTEELDRAARTDEAFSALVGNQANIFEYASNVTRAAVESINATRSGAAEDAGRQDESGGQDESGKEANGAVPCDPCGVLGEEAKAAGRAAGEHAASLLGKLH